MEKADGGWQQRVEAFRRVHPQDWLVVVGLKAASQAKYGAICVELKAFGLHELLAGVTSRLDHLLYETQNTCAQPEEAGAMCRVFEDDDPVFGLAEKQRMGRVAKYL